MVIRVARMTASDHDCTRSIRPLGRPSSRRQRFSARAMRPRIGLVIHAEQVQHAVQHQDADFVFGGSARIRGPARGRAPAEMARSPRWRRGRGRAAGNESTSVA